MTAYSSSLALQAVGVRIRRSRSVAIDGTLGVAMTAEGGWRNCSAVQREQGVQLAANRLLMQLTMRSCDCGQQKLVFRAVAAWRWMAPFGVLSRNLLRDAVRGPAAQEYLCRSRRRSLVRAYTPATQRSIPRGRGGVPAHPHHDLPAGMSNQLVPQVMRVNDK